MSHLHYTPSGKDKDTKLELRIDGIEPKADQVVLTLSKLRIKGKLFWNRT